MFTHCVSIQLLGMASPFSLTAFYKVEEKRSHGCSRAVERHRNSCLNLQFQDMKDQVEVLSSNRQRDATG